MQIQNPYQAQTPIGQAIANLGTAIFSGPTPSEQERQRLETDLLRSRIAGQQDDALKAAAARAAQQNIQNLIGQVPATRAATVAPVADPGVAGPARALAATNAEGVRNDARQSLVDLPTKLAAQGAAFVKSPSGIGDMYRMMVANSPDYTDDQVIRAQAGQGGTIGPYNAVSQAGQERAQSAKVAGDIAINDAKPRTESQVKGDLLLRQPEAVQNLTVGPTFSQVRGNAAVQTMGASNGGQPVPTDTRTLALGAQAFGAPNDRVADPNSPSGVRLVPRNEAAGQPGVPPGAVNKTDASGLTNALKTKLQETVLNAGSSQQMIDMARELAQDPTNFGTTGFLKGTLQDAIEQGNALGQLISGPDGQYLRRQIAGGNAQVMVDPDKAAEGPMRMDSLFDPRLPQLEVVANLLAYRLALVNNPDGRISEADFQNAKRNLPIGGLFGNQAKFLANLSAIEQVLSAQEQGAIAALNENDPMDTSTPAAGSGDVLTFDENGELVQ